MVTWNNKTIEIINSLKSASISDIPSLSSRSISYDKANTSASLSRDSTEVISRFTITNDTRSLLDQNQNNFDLSIEEDFILLFGKEKLVRRIFVNIGNNNDDPLNGFGWIINEDINECMICGKEFGFFRFKHHCRCCGNIVCSTCSPDEAVIEELTQLGAVRVCVICYWGQEPLHIVTHPRKIGNSNALFEKESTESIDYNHDVIDLTQPESPIIPIVPIPLFCIEGTQQYQIIDENNEQVATKDYSHNDKKIYINVCTHSIASVLSENDGIYVSEDIKERINSNANISEDNTHNHIEYLVYHVIISPIIIQNQPKEGILLTEFYDNLSAQVIKQVEIKFNIIIREKFKVLEDLVYQGSSVTTLFIKNPAILTSKEDIITQISSNEMVYQLQEYNEPQNSLSLNESDNFNKKNEDLTAEVENNTSNPETIILEPLSKSSVLEERITNVLNTAINQLEQSSGNIADDLNLSDIIKSLSADDSPLNRKDYNNQSSLDNIMSYESHSNHSLIDLNEDYMSIITNHDKYDQNKEKHRLSRRISFEDTSECHTCSTAFNSVELKNYCRNCYKVVCSSCSLYKILLEEKTDLGQVTVCNSCYDELITINNNDTKINDSNNNNNINEIITNQLVEEINGTESYDNNSVGIYDNKSIEGSMITTQLPQVNDSQEDLPSILSESNDKLIKNKSSPKGSRNVSFRNSVVVINHDSSQPSRSSSVDSKIDLKSDDNNSSTDSLVDCASIIPIPWCALKTKELIKYDNNDNNNNVTNNSKKVFVNLCHHFDLLDISSIDQPPSNNDNQHIIDLFIANWNKDANNNVLTSRRSNHNSSIQITKWKFENQYYMMCVSPLKLLSVEKDKTNNYNNNSKNEDISVCDVTIISHLYDACLAGEIAKEKVSI
eukprot:gene7314-9966_t